LEARFQRNDDGAEADAPEVGEVILCGEDSPDPTGLGGWTDHGGMPVPGQTELWEGLTTNLFIVYKNGILRTAPTDRVLDGYVRHHIVENHQSFGIQSVQEAAPLLEDSDQWREVFVTSSVRLVVPVQSVSVMRGGVRVPVWTSGHFVSRDETNRGVLLWRKIYDALIQSMADSVGPNWPDSAVDSFSER
jgi:hypothetical protein